MRGQRHVRRGALLGILLAGAAWADEVVVGTTVYPIGTVLKCAPYEEYGTRLELELQALHRGDGGRGQLDVSISVMGTLAIQEVSWAGPEGLFARQGMPDEELFEQSSGRISGDLELEDAYGRGSGMRVAFDIGLPGEDFDCR